MNDRFRVTQPCPDVLAVKHMIEERFRAIDPVRAHDIVETLSILGPGYNCHYSVSSPKNTGDRDAEYDAAVMAVFDRLRAEHPHLKIERNNL